MRLFNNRIGIDFSHYNSTSSDQILFIRMPPSAGTFGSYLNAGSITNKGVELLLSARPINEANFKWDIDINASKSTSLVNELPGEIKQVENSDSWAYNSIGEGAAILDGSVVEIALSNRDTLGLNNVRFTRTHIGDVSGEFDTVLMNPPFGAQVPHADRPFLEKALELAGVVWTIHNEGTLDFIEGSVKRKGFEIDRTMRFRFPSIFENL